MSKEKIEISYFTGESSIVIYFYEVDNFTQTIMLESIIYFPYISIIMCHILVNFSVLTHYRGRAFLFIFSNGCYVRDKMSENNDFLLHLTMV